MSIYKMCRVLCPLCRTKWRNEIEMMSCGSLTAIVWCPQCEMFVDGLILKIYEEKGEK